MRQSPAEPKHGSLTKLLDPDGPLYRWSVLGTVMIGTFMAVLDATVVNVALPKLMAYFGVSVDRVEWILTAYLLIFAVMLPSSGWFADHFGHKRLFLFGLALFTFGSLLSSLAWSFDILIAFRVIQGAGAGILMPVGMAIITREFPPEKRGIALGFWSVAASASVSLGPTLGGFLIDRYSWHTIFDINVPIGILGVAASWIILREYRSEEARKFDTLGFLSLGIFLTALLLALANGNSSWNTGGWTSTYILTSFAIAIVGAVVFIINEFSVRHPLIDISLFRSRNFALSNVVLFIFGLGMFGSNFLLPIYLQNSLNYTPLQAGLVFLPVGLILGLTSPLAGLFADKVSAKMPAAVGLFLLALTLYLFSFLSFLTEQSQIMLPLYIRGFAMGLIFSPLATIAITEIPNRKMAQASGLINVIRQVGGSFGVALFGTLLTRRAILHLARYGEQANAQSEAVQTALVKLQYFAQHSTGATPAAARSKAQALLLSHVQTEAFIQGVNDVFRVAAIVVVLCVPFIFFLRGRRKSRALQAQMIRREAGEAANATPGNHPGRPPDGSDSGSRTRDRAAAEKE
jgi:DHA2 family multidrug resistance protein